MAGPLLLKNVREAIGMARKCEEACRDFEEHRPPAVIHEWKTMKLRWEEDPSQPDPYQLVEKGKLDVQLIPTARTLLTLGLVASKFNSMKWKLSEAEASDPKSRNMAPHKLSPLSFVRMGLEIEDQQYVLLFLWYSQ